MADKEQPVTLRTRKFLRNALLSRKQMVVYVFQCLRDTESLKEQSERQSGYAITDLA